MHSNDIRIRDPFILADEQSKTYFLYAQSANRNPSVYLGVEAYASPDLVSWEAPQPVLELSQDTNVTMVWAPEVHAYQGKYYLFVTLTLKDQLPGRPAVIDAVWNKMLKRGTHIFVADSPLGPFTPLVDGPHTPADWMALDGTLWVENRQPFMVFCHEWIQVGDGTVDVIALSKDLTHTIGEPVTLFKASDAPGADASPLKAKVTDGCFLYRSPLSEKLFMIWSTFIPGKQYCLLLTHSESGTVYGPWTEHTILYGTDGGHGMLFHDFAGNLRLALHQPNSGNKERLRLFDVLDNGEYLIIEGTFS